MQYDATSATRRSHARIAQYEMAFRMQTTRAGGDGPVATSREHVFELYGPDAQQAGHVRGQLPAGPAAGRARRPVRPALPPRLGPARRPARRHPPASASDVDQACCGAGHRPEAARAARRHAGRLGRRVRPDELLPGQADRRPTTAATTTRAASPSGWPAAASSRASPTARPTTSATTSSRTRVHVHDLHATILHLLGIDHERLTYKFQGRYYRLTDVHGHVVKDDPGLIRNPTECDL